MHRRTALQLLTQAAIVAMLPATSHEVAGSTRPSELKRWAPPTFVRMVFRTDDSRQIGLHEPGAPTELGAVYRLFREDVAVPHANIAPGLSAKREPERVLKSQPMHEVYVVVRPDHPRSSYRPMDSSGNTVHLALWFSMHKFARVTDKEKKRILAALADSSLPVT